MQFLSVLQLISLIMLCGFPTSRNMCYNITDENATKNIHASPVNSACLCCDLL